MTSPRSKLATCATLGDVVAALGRAKSIVVLAGAGVSVSCGIPDFRSAKGIYEIARDMVSISAID